MVLRCLDQCTQVLGKARATKAGSGMQEFCADSVVETDAARDFLDIGTDFLAEIGDFIDECNLGRQESISCIFYELSSTPGGVKNGRLIKA